MGWMDDLLAPAQNNNINLSSLIDPSTDPFYTDNKYMQMIEQDRKEKARASVADAIMAMGQGLLTPAPTGQAYNPGVAIGQGLGKAGKALDVAPITTEDKIKRLMTQYQLGKMNDEINKSKQTKTAIQELIDAGKPRTIPGTPDKLGEPYGDSTADFTRDLIKGTPAQTVNPDQQDMINKAINLSAVTGDTRTLYDLVMGKKENNWHSLPEGGSLVDVNTGKTFKGTPKDKSPAGYSTNPDGTLKAIPGGPAYEKQQQAAESKAALLESARAKSNIIFNKVDEALSIDDGSSGLEVKAASFIPGTKSYDLNKAIDTIKANVGFAQLQEMRAASKSGASGLGQLAVKELEALQAVLGSLDVGQSPEKRQKNLNAVKTHYQNWLNIMEKSNNQTEKSPISNSSSSLPPSKRVPEGGVVTSKGMYYSKKGGKVFISDANGNPLQ